MGLSLANLYGNLYCLFLSYGLQSTLSIYRIKIALAYLERVVKCDFQESIFIFFDENDDTLMLHISTYKSGGKTLNCL